MTFVCNKNNNINTALGQWTLILQAVANIAVLCLISNPSDLKKIFLKKYKFQTWRQLTNWMNAWKESQEWTKPAINLPIPPGPSTWQVRPGWYVTCYSVKFEIPVRSFDMAWMMMCWHCMGFAMVFFHGGFAFVIWFDLIWAKPAHIKKRWKKLWSTWYLCSKSKQHVESNQTDCALRILKNKTWLLLKAFINLSNQSPPQENLPLRTWSEAAAAAESAPNQFCTCWKLDIILSNSLEHLFRMNTWIIKIWHIFLCLLC